MKSLVSCARVCREWRDPAVLLLYGTPELLKWNPTTANKLLRTVTSSPHLAALIKTLTINFPSVENFEEERDMLQDGEWQEHYSNLSEAEQEVWDDEDSGVRETFEIEHKDEVDQYVRDAYARVLAESGVTGFTSGTRGGPVELRELFASLPALQTLKLVGFQLWHKFDDEPTDTHDLSDDLRLEIGPLPSLLHLDIYSKFQQTRWDSYERSTLLFQAPNLKTLNMDVRKLLTPSFVDFPHLHTIKLTIHNFVRGTDHAVVSRLIAASTQSLRELDLNCTNGEYAEALAPSLTLATNLESLTLAHGKTWGGDYPMYSPKERFLAYLGQSSLQHLALKTPPSPILLASIPTNLTSLHLVRNKRDPDPDVMGSDLIKCAEYILAASRARRLSLAKVDLRSPYSGNTQGLEEQLEMTAQQLSEDQAPARVRSFRRTRKCGMLSPSGLVQAATARLVLTLLRDSRTTGLDKVAALEAAMANSPLETSAATAVDSRTLETRRTFARARRLIVQVLLLDGGADPDEPGPSGWSAKEKTRMGFGERDVVAEFVKDGGVTWIEAKEALRQPVRDGLAGWLVEHGYIRRPEASQVAPPETHAIQTSNRIRYTPPVQERSESPPSSLSTSPPATTNANLRFPRSRDDLAARPPISSLATPAHRQPPTLFVGGLASRVDLDTIRSRLSEILLSILSPSDLISLSVDHQITSVGRSASVVLANTIDVPTLVQALHKIPAFLDQDLNPTHRPDRSLGPGVGTTAATAGEATGEANPKRVKLDPLPPGCNPAKANLQHFTPVNQVPAPGPTVEQRRLAALIPSARSPPIGIKIFEPLPTPPPGDFKRELPIPVSFGFVPAGAAEATLRLQSSKPEFEGEEQLAFERFLRAQAGESYAHYDEMLLMLAEFGRENDDFAKVANSVTGGNV
ncbi:hypothetical protein RQP46_001527 [Phenoliferia psychrophenolica]